MAKFANKKILDGGNIRYTYLDGKKGKNNVTIYKNDEDNWAFKSNDAELTGKQLDSLKADKILPKTVKAPVNPKGISAGGDESSLAIPQGSGPKGGYSAKAGDGAGINSDGALSDSSASVKPNLAESTYSLSGSGGRQMGIGDNNFNSAQLPGKAIGPEGKEFNLAPSEETFEKNYKLAPNYENFDADASNVKGEKGAGGSRFYNPSTVSPHSGIIGANDVSAPGGYNNMASQLDTGTLDIGTGGKDSMWDSSFYRAKNGELMKDSGVFGEDTVATQADITAGIKDQNDNSWGSADGWNAAGSVMKGVGGLASAYTGMKNYQLARDAQNTQRNQWQANYDQQLKAYGDNKLMANNEIAARNRTLKARGQAESYNTIK
jgi:hypothetical protein